MFNMFLAYNALVEKQYGHQILRLRSDNEREYVKKNFTTFCTEQGIQQQHIVPYTTQKNGVAKRNNHTVSTRIEPKVAEGSLPGNN